MTPLDDMTAARSLDEVDDGVLAAMAREGDPGAFNTLVRRYQTSVYAMACYFMHDREEAWDASQEAFTKAFRRLSGFRGECAFRIWLMRITANQCRDMLRRRRFRSLGLDALGLMSGHRIEHKTPAGLSSASELGAAIREALDSLPIKHRTAFILREMEGLSYEEMAQVMQCNAGTVMSRLFHARRKMREQLEAKGYGKENWL